MPLISDQTLLLEKRAESLRWFLYPSEAQQVLLGKHANTTRAFAPPFIPRQHKEDGSDITPQDRTDDNYVNVGIGETVSNNSNSDEQTILDPVRNKLDQRKCKICVGKIVLSSVVLQTVYSHRVSITLNKYFTFMYIL